MLDTDLPVHPFTGLAALAVLDSGRIVWPVLGGAPEDDEDDEGQKDEDGQDDAGDGDDTGEDRQDDGEQDDDGEDKPLGPKGERALAAMKEKLKAERTKRRAAEAKLTDTGKPAEGDKPDPEQARRDAESAATARANQRILRSEVKAAAAGKLADPKDALRFLDLDSFEVDAEGEVDEDEVAEAIDDLLKKKPYLAAAAQGGRRRFEGGGDGGARKGAAKPITEEQLKKMTPAQVEKALDEGKLAHLL